MKRILCLLLALLLTLSLAACALPSNLPEVSDYTEVPVGTGGDLILFTEVPPDGETDAPETDPAPATEAALSEDGVYTSKDDLALYLHLYGHLPSNFITKKEAEALGWTGGSLEPYAPGKCIGGGRFGNYEGLLPEAPGRTYKECDVDTLGARSRGAKRIVWSNDGLIYYTGDHYETFELLYGGDGT